MGQFGTLTRGERRFVVAVIGAPSVREAARAADISESTAWRYLQREHVKKSISMRLEAVTRQVTCGLGDDMSAARKVLRKIVDDPEAADGVRVRAARVIIQSEVQLLGLVDVLSRLEALEEVLLCE